jgi:hypothetical protein
VTRWQEPGPGGPDDATASSSVAGRLQPVVQVHRRTENGEAPGWPGVTTENIGNI